MKKLKLKTLLCAKTRGICGIYSGLYQQKFDDYWNPIIAEHQKLKIKGCLVQQPLSVLFHLFGELFKLGYGISFHGNLYSNLVFGKLDVL